MAVRTVIFDFDGTIADTMELIFSILTQVAPEYGYPSITREEFYAARRLTLREIVHKYHIRWWKLPLIVRRVRREQKQMIHEVPMIPGIAPVIAALQQRGCRLGILSNNREDTVRAFLAAHHVEGFEFIVTVRSIFDKKKALKRLLRRRHLPRQDVVYCGDEVKDIDAARAAGVRSVAVTWGFHTKELLQQNKPDVLVDHPRALIAALV